MPGGQDAEPSCFEVEVGGVAAPGQGVDDDGDGELCALHPVGGVDPDLPGGGRAGQGEGLADLVGLVLRGHGITVNTILMDTATLHRFRHLAADGAGPQRSTLPNLTDTEQELYVYLTEYAATHGTGLLVEQERIPWQHAYQALLTAMNWPATSTIGDLVS